MKLPLRILFVVNVMAVGGAEMFLLRKIKKLRDRGHFAALAYCEKIDGKIDTYLETHLGNQYIYQATYDFRSILPLIKELSIGVVHTVQGHPNFLKEAKNSNPNIICVSTLTASIWDADKKFNHELYTDALVTMADGFTSIIGREVKKPAKIIAVIENGIDPDEFSPGKVLLETQNRLREELGIAPDKKVVIQVGRIHPVKNIEDSLRIAAQVRKTSENIIFLHVGGHRGTIHASYFAQLLEERNRLSLSDAYLFLGDREDIRDLLAIADCVLSTTKAHEGTPNALLEAMSMQRPVVAFNCLGISDLVVDKKTGFLVQIENVNMAAEKILMIMGDPSLGEKMGEEARKVIRQSFSLTRAAGDYEKLYNRLKQNKRRPNCFIKIIQKILFYKNAFSDFFVSKLLVKR